MQIKKFDNEEAWLAGRLGKITGSRLKDVITLKGTGKKIGYYELIAERLARPSDGENPMDRGHRLEDEAIERFKKETGKEVNVDLVLWSRDENDSIAVSPDGTISDTEAIEVKCLSSARHVEALLTREVPKEYEFQALQYFIVNDKLEKLYFAFYDPRLSVKDFFYLTIERDQNKVTEFLIQQENILNEVNTIVTQLSF